MRVRKSLPLSAIKIDRLPLNRKTLALVDFIRNGGQVRPIQVQKRWRSNYSGELFTCDASPPPGHWEYHIRDGRHRWLAHKLLSIEKIEVTFGVKNNE